MKNESLYHKTVGILVDAYFNDMLQHGNQCGCAVGNLVAASMGITLKKMNGFVMPSYWEEDRINFDTSIGNNGLWYQTNSQMRQEYMPIIEKQIENIGYCLDQLMTIERAFESVKYQQGSEDDKMFNGLMAVIDCLDKIHENYDTQLTTETKSKFHKQLSLQ